MSDIAIRVEGLGKQYRIGTRPAYGTFRDALTGLAGLPRRMLKRRTATEESQFWALKDVSFNVKRGEVVGVIGRNGAGKSTLLKILSRITEPTTGEVDIYGRVGSLLEVGTGFHPELTGRENIFLNGAILGMKRAEIIRKFDEIVAFAEVEKFIDTPVKHYSSGMYMRLAFAVAAHLEPEILIVDEVLAVGDAEFQKKCLGKMGDVAKQGRTVLFVSHNMAAVRNLCSRVVMLNLGRLEFDGETAKGIENYSISGVFEDGTRPSHILFKKRDDVTKTASEIEVIQIESLDWNGEALADIRTWSAVRLRMEYRVKSAVRNAHFCIEFVDGYGRRLLSLETRTHTGRDDLGLADGVVEVQIPQLPLAPGTYAVGAAIFVPNQRTVWIGDQLGRLTVNPDDVFGRGHLPPSSHAAIITPHDWTILAS